MFFRRVYFIFIPGLTFVWVFLIASSITNAKENSVDLDALYTLFETVAKPILESVQVDISEDDENNEQELYLPTTTTILLEELKTQQVENISFVPNKHMSNEIPVKEDSEETVILEIPSSSETLPNRRKGDLKPIFNEEPIAKYKQLQDKIGSLLNKEKISDKTKDLLTNAFDKVINQINRPCISNKLSKDLKPEMKRRLLGKLDKAARKAMLNSWKLRFNKLIDRYRENDDVSETLGIKENSKFLAKLRDFFFEMHNDFQNLTSRYDLSCNVVNIKKIGRHNEDAAELDTSSTFDKLPENMSEACQFFKICPYELKVFLIDFYADVLHKINLIFNNYTKMYLADVSKESSEKKTFIRVMDNVNYLVKKKYNELVAKEKGKIALDSRSGINAKAENIKKIIDKTITKTKTFIESALKEKDRSEELPSKIQSVVTKDIMTSANIELGEVQQKFKAKMCKSFETCYDKERRKKPDNLT